MSVTKTVFLLWLGGMLYLIVKKWVFPKPPVVSQATLYTGGLHGNHALSNALGTSFVTFEGGIRIEFRYFNTGGAERIEPVLMLGGEDKVYLPDETVCFFGDYNFTFNKKIYRVMVI